MGIVRMLYLAGILLLALLSPTYGDPVERCYNFDTTYDQSLIIRNISDVWDNTACQGYCYDDPDCMAFTHWYMADICSLFSNTSMPVSCDYTCESGPKECDMCSHRNTTCSQGVLDITTNTTTETICQQMCYSTPECSTYTWFTPTILTFLGNVACTPLVTAPRLARSALQALMTAPSAFFQKMLKTAYGTV